MVKINININNKAYSEEVEDNTLLVELLRDKLGLTGTHVGCDTSQCGACVIHVDGDSVKSCTVLAAQVDGKNLTTVEGLASEGQLHPIQKSFQKSSSKKTIKNLKRERERRTKRKTFARMIHVLLWLST